MDGALVAMVVHSSSLLSMVYLRSIVLHGNDVRSDFPIRCMREVVVAESFEDEDLYYLVRNCKKLQNLKLQYTYQCNTPARGLCWLQKYRKLEEFSFSMESVYTEPEESFTQVATVLLDVLRQCTNLRKVSLTGDALRGRNVEDLLPYGHLFDELKFKGRHDRSMGYGQAVANLLVACTNLWRLRYESNGEQHDGLVLVAIHRSCPSLEALVLESFHHIIDADTFTRIGRNCPHLCTLTLGTTFELSEFSIRAITGMQALTDLRLLCCYGLTDAGMALLATMKLERLSVLLSDQLTDASLQSFIESNISQTLEDFSVLLFGDTILFNDVEVALAMASCHKLRRLFMSSRPGAVYVFGHNGLAGLQAMATGCPLLSDVSLYLTVSGMHYIGTHFTSLKNCEMLKRRDEGAATPEGFPSVEELRTLYPAVDWAYSDD